MIKVTEQGGSSVERLTMEICEEAESLLGRFGDLIEQEGFEFIANSIGAKVYQLSLERIQSKRYDDDVSQLPEPISEVILQMLQQAVDTTRIIGIQKELKAEDSGRAYLSAAQEFEREIGERAATSLLFSISAGAENARTSVAEYRQEKAIAPENLKTRRAIQRTIPSH